MKAWEVLKAIDEGKNVQFRCTGKGDWTSPSAISTWTVYQITTREWRIKPEPVVLYRQVATANGKPVYGLSWYTEEETKRFPDKKYQKFISVDD